MNNHECVLKLEIPPDTVSRLWTLAGGNLDPGRPGHGRFIRPPLDPFLDPFDVRFAFGGVGGVLAKVKYSSSTSVPVRATGLPVYVEHDVWKYKYKYMYGVQ